MLMQLKDLSIVNVEIKINFANEKRVSVRILECEMSANLEIYY